MSYYVQDDTATNDQDEAMAELVALRAQNAKLTNALASIPDAPDPDALAAEQAKAADFKAGMAACRNEQEMTAYLMRHEQAGTLPGMTPPPRNVGNGRPPTSEEIRATTPRGSTRADFEEAAARLDALLSERVGDLDAHELGLADKHWQS